jgi:hypothetical protein
MKVYYGKKVHTQPFHALLKKLLPQGRLATYGRGERAVVSNSNPPVTENSGLAVASVSARLWKFYTNPGAHWGNSCVSSFTLLKMSSRKTRQKHCIQGCV